MLPTKKEKLFTLGLLLIQHRQRTSHQIFRAHSRHASNNTSSVPCIHQSAPSTSPDHVCICQRYSIEWRLPQGTGMNNAADTMPLTGTTPETTDPHNHKTGFQGRRKNSERHHDASVDSQEQRHGQLSANSCTLLFSNTNFTTLITGTRYSLISTTLLQSIT